MTAYKRQKEKISIYLPSDSSIPSGPGVKSKILPKELEFLGPYLLSTMGPTAYCRQRGLFVGWFA